MPFRFQAALPLAFLLAAAAPARDTVALFGLLPGEDPLFSTFFGERVYRILSADTGLVPVTPKAWRPWALENALPPKTWRLEDYHSLSRQTGARYFALAFREPFRYAQSRIWWKPWELRVRTFQPLRLQVYAVGADTALFDGVLGHQDSLRRVTPWSWKPARRDDPVAYDAWARAAYAALAARAADGIRAAAAGRPLASDVFVEKPPKAKKEKKKK